MIKKYHILDDKEWLFAQLIQKSMADLAEELAKEYGVPKRNMAGSIRFMVYRYFSKDQRNLLKKDRAFHKNRKKHYNV